MFFATDISPNFLAIGQANASDFAHSGVRFLWGFGGDSDADASLQWAVLLVGLSLERVLNRQMVDLIDLFAIRVRKLATCLGTNRVNRAKVV